MAVQRYMTARPITVAADDSIWDALTILRSHRIRHLPVLHGKRLVGVFSDRDLRLVLPSSLAVPEEQERFHAWGTQVKVGDVMTRRVVTVAPETETEKAARLMVRHRIGCLPVLRGQTLVGIITTIDLLRAMTDKHSPHAAPTKQSKPPGRKRRTGRSSPPAHSKRLRRH